MASGYYLLDHPNPTGAKYYTTRSKRAKYIVIHTAENLPDVTPPDLGAESIAKYLASTTRAASCHECVDTDSYIPMAPDSYTTWHAKGANADGWGLEICTQAAKWADLPESYRDVLYRMAANRSRRAALALDIPMVKTQPGGPSGFFGHTEIDPSRRSDPGRHFRWDYFLALVNQVDVGVTAPPHIPVVGSAPPVNPPIRVPAFPLPPGHYFGPRSGAKESVSGYYSHREDLRRWQQRMKDRGWSLSVDGLYGDGTAKVVRGFQADKRMHVDGLIGPNTWRMAWAAAVTT